MTNTRDPQYTGPFAAAHGRAGPLAAASGGGARGAVESGLERTDDCWFAAPLVWLGIRAAADLGT